MEWKRILDGGGYWGPDGEIEHTVEKYDEAHKPTGWYFYPFAPTLVVRGPFKTLREAKVYAEKWEKK